MNAALNLARLADDLPPEAPAALLLVALIALIKTVPKNLSFLREAKAAYELWQARGE